MKLALVDAMLRLRSWMTAGTALFGMLALSACCTTTTNEECAVMDPSVSVCPAPDGISGVLGNVVSGATQRYYIDLRADADPSDRGIVCCYQVEHQSCSDFSVY